MKVTVQYPDISNDRPFTLLAGVNVLGSRDMAFYACEHCEDLSKA